MQTRRTAGDPKGKSRTADASKRLPRTQKGWRTRERLITAAAAVINAEGYQASTVENIARKAGVPIGLYYRHFKDKTDIAFAVLEKAAEDFRGKLLSLAAQRSLMGREMAMHELLYDTLRDNFRVVSSYFSARKEDGKLVAFFQDQTAQFMEDFHVFLVGLNVVPPIMRRDFEVLGRALIGFSENTLHRNFAGLDASVAVTTQNRSMMVCIMSELRYRALTCEDPAAGYTPMWTMRLRRGKRAAFAARLLDRAFNIPMKAASSVVQPSPQRADARATLVQIERGTLDGLNIHGSAALKLSDIEAESGITRGAIYYHFKNKDALVRKVLVDWLDPLENDLSDANDNADAAPYDRLHAAVKIFVEAFCNAPGALRAIHELEPVDAAVAAAYRRCRSVFARRLAKIILDCGEGPEPAPEALGFVVHGMIAMIERLARDRFIIPDTALQDALPGAEEMIAALAAILHRMAWCADPPCARGLPAPVHEADAAKPL